MAINQNIPDAWSSYVTQTNLGLEVVPSVLYDTLNSAATATQPDLRFFQQINVPADISNMKTAGMLANPEAFLIEKIRIFFRVLATSQTPGTPGAGQPGPFLDEVLLSNAGIGELTIGNKKYGPWPMWMLPSANFVTGSVAAEGATAAGSIFQYSQLGGPLYPLFPNLMLSPLQPFVFTLRWPSGLIQNLSAATVIEVLFDGQLARSIQ